MKRHDGGSSAEVGLFFVPGAKPPPPPTPQPLPDKLRPLVEKVLADMQHPAPLQLEAGYLADNEPGGGIVLVQPNDDSSYGFGIDLAANETDLLIAIADGVSEHISETPEGWGQARPPCPGHPHPAEPTEYEGAAWWRCPRDGTPIARIGSFSRRPAS
jgi:hypothetical protein